MKCFTCGNEMKSVNDYSNEGYGCLTIYRCLKCNSNATTQVNKNGFIKEVKWQADYDWKDKKDNEK